MDRKMVTESGLRLLCDLLGNAAILFGAWLIDPKLVRYLLAAMVVVDGILLKIRANRNDFE